MPLYPVETLEIGGDRNGDVFLAAYRGADERRYVITMPREGRDVLSVRGLDDDFEQSITKRERVELAASLRRLVVASREGMSPLADDCLNALANADARA